VVSWFFLGFCYKYVCATNIFIAVYTFSDILSRREEIERLVITFEKKLKKIGLTSKSKRDKPDLINRVILVLP
jgi:hypothetical protein